MLHLARQPFRILKFVYSIAYLFCWMIIQDGDYFLLLNPTLLWLLSNCLQTHPTASLILEAQDFSHFLLSPQLLLHLPPSLHAHAPGECH